MVQSILNMIPTYIRQVIRRFLRQIQGQAFTVAIIAGVVVLATWYLIRVLNKQETQTLLEEQLFVGGGGVSPKTLVLYYAPWCGACKAIKPTWDSLMQKHHGKKDGEYELRVEQVNGDENPEIIEKLQIDGFPTVIMHQDGEDHKYEGDRSLESLEKFLYR